MEILSLQPQNISDSIAKSLVVLRSGGLIVYPTETCYGIGVDATNQNAVEKLLRYKERPEGKAISIAVCDGEMAKQYVEVNKTAENLYKNFLPGPITVISQAKGTQGDSKGMQGNSGVARGIVAEDGSLGIRIPNYPFVLKLIAEFRKPITATSANMSGRKTPYKIEDILDNIPEKKKELIGLVIDAGELPHNPPSTVVDTRLNDERVLREGLFQIQSPKSKIQSILSHSEEETQKIGEDLMKELLPELQDKTVVFALQGDLGAGKTQVAKGVARALGIKENITSPTFTIIKEYNFNIKSSRYQIPDTKYFFHIDTWRMEKEQELSDLGFEKMLVPGNVVVIEWAEKVPGLFQKLHEDIVVRYLKIEGEKVERTIQQMKI